MRMLTRHYDEKRDHRRLKVKTLVAFQRGNLEVKGTAINLSSKGILFECHHQLQSGFKMKGYIGTPASHIVPLTVQIEVIRQTSPKNSNVYYTAGRLTHLK